MTTPNSTDPAAQVSTALVNCLATAAPLAVSNEQLPLAGRPLLQRVIEVLIRAGIRDIILLGADAELASYYGDGTRWGCRLRYATGVGNESVGALCERLGFQKNTRYLLADASALPAWSADQTAKIATLSCAGAVWTSREDGVERWTGWGGFPGSWLLSRPERLDDGSFAGAAIGNDIGVPFPVSQLLRCRTIEQLLAANRDLLEATGMEKPEIGRGCRIHSGARLVAPVWLGDNVEVRDGAVVGPHCSVGDGAMIGENCTITNAVIGPETFLGNGLNVDGGAVAGAYYANARLDVVLKLHDQHLLSPATPAMPRNWGLRALAYRIKAGRRRQDAGVNAP